MNEYSEIMLDMLAYSIESTMICCILICIYKVFSHNSKQLRAGDIFIMAIMIGISSIRYNVGSDYMRYLDSAKFVTAKFHTIGSLFSADVLKQYSYQIGFPILAIIANIFSKSQYAIFWIISFVLYVPIIFFCRKRTNDAVIAFSVFLLFGYWLFSLSILKQAIALVLLLYASEALCRKKYILFLVLSFIAILFHTTAIIAIIALLIVNFKWIEPTKKNFLIFVLGGIVLRGGTSILINAVSRISIFNKYMSYLAIDNTRIQRSFIWIGVLIETVLVSAILYMGINKRKELKEIDPNIDRTLSMIMIGVPFGIIGISSKLWPVERFTKYFFPYLMVLIPALMGRKKNRKFVFAAKTRKFMFIIMVIWHCLESVLFLDNNTFLIQTYLFM